MPLWCSDGDEHCVHPTRASLSAVVNSSRLLFNISMTDVFEARLVKFGISPEISAEILVSPYDAVDLITKIGDARA